MRVFLFLTVLLLTGALRAAENLLIVDVYARILPEGQVEPIPDPFLEDILNRKEAPSGTDLQQIQGRTFQIRSESRDFSAVIPGVNAQRIELSLTAVVLRNGRCAVTDFQLGAASESSLGNLLPSNASQTMSRGGFSIAPGERISQSVSVKSKSGVIFYYLIFSAAKGITE